MSESIEAAANRNESTVRTFCAVLTNLNLQFPPKFSYIAKRFADFGIRENEKRDRAAAPFFMRPRNEDLATDLRRLSIAHSHRAGPTWRQPVLLESRDKYGRMARLNTIGDPVLRGVRAESQLKREAGPIGLSAGIFF
jgi:hypothetical protein